MAELAWPLQLKAAGEIANTMIYANRFLFMGLFGLTLISTAASADGGIENWRLDRNVFYARKSLTHPCNLQQGVALNPQSNSKGITCRLEGNRIHGSDGLCGMEDEDLLYITLRRNFETSNSVVLGLGGPGELKCQWAAGKQVTLEDVMDIFGPYISRSLPKEKPYSIPQKIETGVAHPEYENPEVLKVKPICAALVDAKRAQYRLWTQDIQKSHDGWKKVTPQLRSEATKFRVGLVELKRRLKAPKVQAVFAAYKAGQINEETLEATVAAEAAFVAEQIHLNAEVLDDRLKYYYKDFDVSVPSVKEILKANVPELRDAEEFRKYDPAYEARWVAFDIPRSCYAAAYGPATQVDERVKKIEIVKGQSVVNAPAAKVQVAQ